MKTSKLSEFYQNKNVFITGVTGFIGKVLLIKLLYSLKGCGQVYVLMRAKKGLGCEERLSNMLKKEPFVPAPDFDNPTGVPSGQDSIDVKYIKREELQELDFSKIVAVEGDMRLDGLGIKNDLRENLYKNVDIIFNVAACIKFDAPLKENLQDNYYGTRNLLEFATNVKNLISLVHVSTFYTNLHLSHIDEKVLPMNRDCEKMAELITLLPDSIMDVVTPSLIEDRVNSYIFTKAMSENLLIKYETRLPIAIVRPSMVVPSYKDPFSGWVDSVMGPIGPMILIAMGVVRVVDWDYYGTCDLIPVDYVVNLLLAVCERTARLQSGEIKVYNCSSGSINRVTYGRTCNNIARLFLTVPPMKIVRVPIRMPISPSKFQLICAKASELLFAYFADLLMILFRKKPILTKITVKWHQLHKLTSNWSKTTYTCSNDNLIAAYGELSPDDREEFSFNPSKINWELWMKNSTYAFRRLILREDLSNLPQARKKLYFQMAIKLVVSVSFYVTLAIIMYGTLLKIISFT